MIRDHSHRANRSAFTLVELTVVILIIAILVSMVSSVVMKAMQKIPETQTRTEISQLEISLQAFMSDFNLTTPPPSLLLLNETSPLSVGGASAAFLQQAFGKNLGPTDWNGDGVIAPITVTWTLQGHQALIFYVGGIPSAAGPLGFSTNNMNPAFPGGKRKGPYFTFSDTSRLKPPPATAATLAPGFPVYIDPWQSKTGAFFAAPTTVPGVALLGTPYAYFSCYGVNNGYSITDCSGLAYTDALGTHSALPYQTSGTTFTNSNKYQIISAGKDGKFGYSVPGPNLWIPASGATGTGADDQANFSAGLLGQGIQ